MKSLIHFFFSYLIISSFILNPVAQANVHAELTSKVAAKLASYKTYSDIVQDLSITSPAVAKELKDFYTSRGVLKEKVAPFSFTGTEIVIQSEKNVKVNFSKDGAEVTIGNQKKSFTKSMSVSEMALKLEEFNKVSNFSFTNLLIQDAHAEAYAVGVAVLAIILGAILTGIYTLADSYATDKKANEVLKLCHASEEASLEDLTKAYNVASQYYKKNCVLTNASHMQEECEHLRKAVGCFSDRIEKLKGANNSLRSPGKEINDVPASHIENRKKVKATAQ